MSDFIRADAWIGLCDLIDELGGDSQAVLAASGLSEEDLRPVERYIPMSRFIAMLNNAVASTGRKDFGLQLGLRRQLSQIGVVGLAMQNGSSWRTIIGIAAKIGHIANPLVTYALEPANLPGTEFIWVDDSAATVPHREQGIERTLTFIITSARGLVRPDFVPRAVHIRHSRIADIEAYVAALGVEPMFNQPKTGIVVETANLDKPIQSRSPEVGSLAMAYLENNNLIAVDDVVRAARLTARSLVELREDTAANLARALGVAPAALQRRLKADETSIAGVFDEARRSLVKQLLADNLHSIAEVTHLLGYATPATLTRNCKRWFGDTPGNLRGMDVASFG